MSRNVSARKFKYSRCNDLWFFKGTIGPDFPNSGAPSITSSAERAGPSHTDGPIKSKIFKKKSEWQPIKQTVWAAQSIFVLLNNNDHISSTQNYDTPKIDFN